MTLDTQTGRSISFEPMPTATGDDYAAYFPGGIIEAQRIAADNAAWILESLNCSLPKSERSL